MSNNLDQLTDWLKEHKITEVECLISDLTGGVVSAGFVHDPQIRQAGR